MNFNPLSTSPTKWSNALKQFVETADELFQYVWTFYGVGALKVKHCLLE